MGVQLSGSAAKRRLVFVPMTSPNPQFAQPGSSWIKLNVGGSRFVTTRQTLCKFPDSMLGEMFGRDEGFPLVTDQDGCVFIDRDDGPFRTILTFLRCGEFEMPAAPADLKALIREARYYMLDVHMGLGVGATTSRRQPGYDVITRHERVVLSHCKPPAEFRAAVDAAIAAGAALVGGVSTTFTDGGHQWIVFFSQAVLYP